MVCKCDSCSVYICNYVLSSLVLWQIRKFYFNPLTTDDEYTRHATLTACYQLAEAFIGRRALTIVNLLMSWHGRGREP